MRRWLAGCLLVLAVVLFVSLRDDAGGLDPAVTAAVRPLVEACSVSTVAIIRDGAVDFADSWGQPALDTSFAWASVSKTATALIAMRLVSEGRIRLDAPAWDYAPAWKKHSPYPSPTIEQLLSHGGGLARAVKKRGPAMFVAPPDGTWRYSSTAYGIVGNVLAKASGETFAALVTRFVAGATVGKSFLAPAAGLRSTVRELGSFGALLLADAALAEMRRPRVRMPAGRDYGLGLELGPGAVAHSGKNGADRALLYLEPEARRGVAAFCVAKEANAEIPWWEVAAAIVRAR